MKEYVTYNELYRCYRDCLRHKSNKWSALLFNFDVTRNLWELHKQLNNMTYEISDSLAFCVSRPKVREVFAANFRDRIIHHLLMNRYGDLIDDCFIEDTYNCRKYKGTLYGAQRIQQKMREADEGDYILKCDLKGFFMSIDKAILLKQVEKLLKAYYLQHANIKAENIAARPDADAFPAWMKHKQDDKDLDWILWLTRMVILHRPELNCYKTGNLKLWDRLEKEKSLFGTDGTRGLAIGNLTSQIYANFYLTPFDILMESEFPGMYGRYVDDFICIGRKERLLAALPKIRAHLKDELHVTLHPKKIYLQPVTHGVTFVGYIIKKDRMYTSNRTVGNYMDMMLFYDRMVEKYGMQYMRSHMREVQQRMSSYTGFLTHTSSYRIRDKVWNSAKSDWGRLLKANKERNRITVKRKYKNLIK